MTTPRAGGLPEPVGLPFGFPLRDLIEEGRDCLARPGG